MPEGEIHSGISSISFALNAIETNYKRLIGVTVKKASSCCQKGAEEDMSGVVRNISSENDGNGTLLLIVAWENGSMSSCRMGGQKTQYRDVEFVTGLGQLGCSNPAEVIAEVEQYRQQLIGEKVTRGPTWNEGDEDGGGLGTVTNISYWVGRGSEGPLRFTVEWEKPAMWGDEDDDQSRGYYRMGGKERYQDISFQNLKSFQENHNR
eukprot:CAMPEP_0113898914 /NCGR_PEP_ID=MMETSP0780_2-20120614/19697_1 /TAXON_ID=652834 /ORGANISM="Palpitomonas bilix" /LENGTH=206 /DNA_ID=CAMNT_0000890937 /DNA_START=134 /DNA_END=754 /DNA_ORIENTATION=+ /assembly_acc=CAM_ASM_000599